MLKEDTYIDVASQESYFSGQSIGVKLSISIDRDFTEEEKSEFSSITGELVQMLRHNTVINKSKYIANKIIEKQATIDLFPAPIFVKEVPNEYDTKTGYPWFLVTTLRGIIKIGWRKRVISIDWAESNIEANGYVLFINEDVTKWNTGIHAWSYDAARDYINRLLNS